MRLRPVVVLALAVVGVYGCTRRPPPQPDPGPQVAAVDSAAIRAAREQARRDSIATADRLAREAAERDRVARVARAREALSDIVYFEYDSDELTAEAQQKLQTKIAILRANPTLQVQVEGHADERGSTEYNIALAQRRAETVRDFLSSYGVDAGRVATISYGEERPLVEGSQESAWSRNRRAEFGVAGGEITTVPSEVQ